MNQAATQSSDPDRRAEVRAALLWCAVAGLLRFGRLGAWSLWGDEAFSHIDTMALLEGHWRDSVTAYPLYFLLQAALVSLDLGPSLEWNLRVLPALSGALGAGALYLLPRGLMLPAQRHVLAAMVTFSPWLLFHAQFARFYSLLFLFSALATFGYLQALRHRSARCMVLAVLALLLATATHSTGAILLSGWLVHGLLWTRREPGGLRTTWPILAVVGLLLCTALIFWDAVRRTIVYQLERRDTGETLLGLVQGIAYNFGLAVSGLIPLGVLALRRSAPHLWGSVLLLGGLPCAALFALAATGAPVEQRYFIPLVPILWLPVAILVVDLGRALSRLAPCAVPGVTTLLLLPSFPALLSHYQDGNRHDLRRAARFVAERLGEEDMVVAENHYLFQLYVPELDAERLLEAPPDFGSRLEEFQQLMLRYPRVWVILPDQFLDLGGARQKFYQWAMHEGQLEQEYYASRLDYHQNRLSVFLVDARHAARFRPR